MTGPSPHPLQAPKRPFYGFLSDSQLTIQTNSRSEALSANAQHHDHLHFLLKNRVNHCLIVFTERKHARTHVHAHMPTQASLCPQCPWLVLHFAVIPKDSSIFWNRCTGPQQQAPGPSSPIAMPALTALAFTYPFVQLSATHAGQVSHVNSWVLILPTFKCEATQSTQSRTLTEKLQPSTKANEMPKAVSRPSRDICVTPQSPQKDPGQVSLFNLESF